MNAQSEILRWENVVRSRAFFWVRRCGDIPFDDFVQEGWIGVMQALERYEPRVGVKLVTFVILRIDSCMMDFIRAQRHKWPVHTGRKTFAKAEQVDETLPTPDKRSARAFSALNAAMAVETLLADQSERTRDILRDNFIEGLNQPELANKYNISASRISQIISRAMKAAQWKHHLPARTSQIAGL